ncbi:MAG: aminoglycoside phosphotransferase family protein [Alphaproteobacteria bacterium]|nr:aminoglycoside phosphotransferase family protein [Alphaproteobacteria bacterium]
MIDSEWKNKPIIGRGVWGCVHDMGDGTVLKRARESGGIGSGAEKIQHEIRMMQALAPHMAGVSFAIPAVIDSGVMPEDADGFCLWLRCTKVPGTVYQTPDFAGFSEARRIVMIAVMARALAEFHGLLDRAKMLLPQNNLWDDMVAMNLSAADAERVANVRALFTGNEILRAVHGDFNITNLLFDETDRVCGVLDFAEMCGGAREDDLAALSSEFPESRDIIVQAYEQGAGVKIDAARLRAAEIKNDLLSLCIARYRQGNEAEAQVMAERLDKALAR